MNEALNAIFAFTLVGGIFALIFGLIIFMNKKLVHHYTVLGEKLGLKLNVTKKFFGLNQFPVLSGTYKNQQVVLSRYVRGAGKHKQAYTYISIGLVDPGFEFSIAKEGFLNKLFGGQEVKFNDEEFDKAFFIKSKSEDKVHRVIDASVRKVLMEVRAQKIFDGNITLQNGDFRYTVHGDMIIEKARQRLEGMAEVMVFLAGKVSGRS